MADDEQQAALTQTEIIRLKKIAKEDERMEWLWSTVRRHAAWWAGILAGLIAFREDLVKAVSWIIGR